MPYLTKMVKKLGKTMEELFGNYASIIIFLHILSAVIWVGGMIAIRFAVHPSLQSIDDPQIKLGKTLQIVGRLFNIVLPFIFISLTTALIMIIGAGFSGGIVHLKEAIWTLMTLNFIYMYIKRYKAVKLFNKGDLASSKKAVALLPTVLLPINIVLGLIAIFSGVILRGF